METEIEIAERTNAALRAQIAEQTKQKRLAHDRKLAEQAELRRKVREKQAEILFVRQALQARRINTDMAESPLDRIRRLEQSNYWLRRLAEEQEERQP